MQLYIIYNSSCIFDSFFNHWLPFLMLLVSVSLIKDTTLAFNLCNIFNYLSYNIHHSVYVITSVS